MIFSQDRRRCKATATSSKDDRISGHGNTKRGPIQKFELSLNAALEPCDREILAEFKCFWTEVDSLWQQHQAAPAFEGYVSADYLSVFYSLAQLRNRVSTVLEWGSGLGVVSIMASRMGFEAFGIEAEAGLVEYALGFAEKYGPETQFAHGSFIPDEFVWNPNSGEQLNRTVIDLPAAYDQFELELQDFDLIYAYPWPEEHQFYHSILRQFGRPGALLLTYDGREGLELCQVDQRCE